MKICEKKRETKFQWSFFRIVYYGIDNEGVTRLGNVIVHIASQLYQGTLQITNTYPVSSVFLPP